jgi:hypothetical protein
VTSLFAKLKKDSHHWANEEELRKSWLKHIENELGISFHAERERNDASYNQVIIEFKDKGLFKGSTKSTSFKEAIFDRLVSVRKHLESSESYVIQVWRSDLKGRRCGRRRTAVVTTEAGYAIRAI